MSIASYTLSPWGAIIVLLLAAGAASLFWLLDRRLFGQLLRSLGLLVTQLLVAAAFVWGFYRLNSWWADVFCLLVAAGGGTLSAYKMAHQHERSQLLPLFLGLLAGCTVLGFSMLLSLKAMPPRLMIVAIAAALSSMLATSVAAAFQTYEACLSHTKLHREYLIANGATPFESLVPSYRRALRAAVVTLLRGSSPASPTVAGVVPLFMAGLLVGGVPPLTALAVSVLFLVASFAASVLATVVILAYQTKIRACQKMHS